MKQIKTITFRDPHDFDEAVNKALRGGWKLIERSLVQSPAGYSDYHYAELERDDFVPAYASCTNCAHSVNGDPDPGLTAGCRRCRQCSLWTPRQ